MEWETARLLSAGNDFHSVLLWVWCEISHNKWSFMQKSSRLQKTARSAIISHQARVVLRRVDLDLARDVFPSYPGAALVYSRLEERAKRRGGYK